MSTDNDAPTAQQINALKQQHLMDFSMIVMMKIFMEIGNNIIVAEPVQTYVTEPVAQTVGTITKKHDSMQSMLRKVMHLNKQIQLQPLAVKILAQGNPYHVPRILLVWLIMLTVTQVNHALRDLQGNKVMPDDVTRGHSVQEYVPETQMEITSQSAAS
ncbi:hypothetical protein L195_g047452 [Trifolium pratense]|uniref:Uncharacterized protein n=1 Tax=Trifolium pratense TaxID=57577 RepID=A0A2K3MKK0_TRIPR|nr:hypothetical protein L195_g047452 [Trifolium pratense]